MKRWLARIVTGIVVMIAVVFAIGFTLPRDHRATSRIVVGQAPAAVWDAVRDVGTTPAWWSGLRSAVRLPDDSRGQAWDETFADFRTRVTLQIDSTRWTMTSVLDGTGQGFGGTWTYVVTSDSEATVVTVTEAGWVSNPVFRVLSHLSDVHGTIDSYLIALGHHFGETVTPQHLE